MASRESPLHRDEEPLSSPLPAIKEFGLHLLAEERGELWKEGIPLSLNTQEWRLLRYFAAHPQRVLDRAEILEQVWGYGSDTTTRTVDVHVAKLRHHLDESHHPKHILTVRGRGYFFQP